MARSVVAPSAITTQRGLDRNSTLVLIGEMGHGLAPRFRADAAAQSGKSVRGPASQGGDGAKRRFRRTGGCASGLVPSRRGRLAMPGRPARAIGRIFRAQHDGRPEARPAPKGY
jgi:hypothetical protein